MAHERAGRPLDPQPVKLFAALLLGKGFEPAPELFPELEELFGRIDYSGRNHPFTVTDYYEDEMGPGLSRLIVSFEPLTGPTRIVAAKLACAETEERFVSGRGRRVNIDCGYIDYFKVVLASFKEGPQKIYLGDGVYADPVLMYHEGSFEALAWTFPDFRKGTYDAELLEVRRLYRKARRARD